MESQMDTVRNWSTIEHRLFELIRAIWKNQIYDRVINQLEFEQFPNTNVYYVKEYCCKVFIVSSPGMQFKSFLLN